MTKYIEPIGFWSYARQDDELAGRKLTRLRKLVGNELQLQYGRRPIKLFQDTSMIPHGAAWERRIVAAVNQSTFFIPVITPGFIQSEWCCREVRLFLERESELLAQYPDLPPTSRIFPIDYRKIREANALDGEVLAALKERTWWRFQDLRDKDPGSEEVSAALHGFAESICEMLFTEVQSPDDPAPPQPVEEAARAPDPLPEEPDPQRNAVRLPPVARQGPDRLDPAPTGPARSDKEVHTEPDTAVPTEREDSTNAVAEPQSVQPAADLPSGKSDEAAATAAPSPVVEGTAEKAKDRTPGTARAGPEAQPADELPFRRRPSRGRVAAPHLVDDEAAAQKRLRLEALRKAPAPARKAKDPPVLAVLLILLVVAVIITYAILPGETTAPPSVEIREVKAEPAAAPPPEPEAWLYRKWGIDGDCSVPMNIFPDGDRRLTVVAGGERVTREIVGTPSATVVETSEGSYRRQKDGSMRTSEAGMEKLRMAPCGE